MSDRKLSMFKAAEIRQQLREDPELVAVSPLPERMLELVAHGIPYERAGFLYCLGLPDGDRIAMMERGQYEDLKRQEEDLIRHAEQNRQG